jgi:hypothetical protein
LLHPPLNVVRNFAGAASTGTQFTFVTITNWNYARVSTPIF